jgi:GNAT superfamily N-acetyltransferase
MGEVTIRRAGVDDAFVVAALHLQLARERAMPPEPGFLDRFVDAWLSERAGRPTWFAEYRDEHAGVLEARRVRSLPWPGRPDSSWLHLGVLFVTPAQRGRGVGRALMEGMLDWARGTDVGIIRLEVPHAPHDPYDTDAPDDPARGFPEHFGFEGSRRIMELDLRRAP